jgi:PAS domain S-box-containing protein
MQRPVRPALRIVRSSESRQLLAMVEAEVGSLLELLPVPVLVTSEAGIVLRANPAACVAVGIAEQTLVGKAVDDVLKQSGLSARMRTLCHADEVLRLYVL